MIRRFDLFCENIYDPLYNGRFVKQARRSETSLKKALRGRSTDIYYALKLIKILHFVAAALSDRKNFSAPSIKQALKVYSAVSNLGYSITGGSSPNTVRPHWNRCRHSSAFLYSAQFIKDEQSNRSFLELMLDGKLSFKTATPQLKTWFGQARYMTETVLVHAEDPAGNSRPFPVVDNVEPAGIPRPVFDDNDPQAVEKQFRLG